MQVHTVLKWLHELRLAGRRETAEAACRAFLADDPENADVLWELGSLCYEAGRADEALVMLGRAVASARSTGRTPPLDWLLSQGAVQQTQGA